MCRVHVSTYNRPAHRHYPYLFIYTLRLPPRSTPFPTRRSSDLTYQGQSRMNVLLNFRRGKTVFAQKVCQKLINKQGDRKSTRLNSSHVSISYAVFCLKKKIKTNIRPLKQRRCARTGRSGIYTPY